MLALLLLVASIGGRPPTIALDILRELVIEGWTVKGIASKTGWTEAAIKQAKHRNGIRSYPPLTDTHIDAILASRYPAIPITDGYREVTARLRCVASLRSAVCFVSYLLKAVTNSPTHRFSSPPHNQRLEGFQVCEHRVRLRWNICHPVAAERRALWMAHRLVRRSYWAPYAMYSWHVDMNCKLVDVGIYWTAGVDGCSRRTLWLAPVTDMRAITSWPFFQRAAQQFGVPDQLVVDKGGENILPAFACAYVYHNPPEPRPRRSPSISVPSVHNVRVERYWGDVNIIINLPVRRFLSYLATNEDFSTADVVRLGVVQRVLLPAMMVAAELITGTRNQRRVKGKNGGIPLRRFAALHRPAHLHRPLPDGDFPALYDNTTGHNLREAVAAEHAHDPLEGTDMFAARDVECRALLNAIDRWDCLCRGDFQSLTAVYLLDLQMTNLYA